MLKLTLRQKKKPPFAYKNQAKGGCVLKLLIALLIQL